MGNSYRLRIVKGGAPPIECAGKIDQSLLRLARANGDLLYGVPLERIAGLSHPAPNVLRIKLVVNESSVGTLELQEAATGGGFAPVTALYSELVKSLEGLKGKPRHRAGSMSPIGMSNYLKQAAASFGAPQDASAFLTIEDKSSAVQAQPRQASPSRASPPRPQPPPTPVMLRNPAFDEGGPPGMFDDDDDDGGGAGATAVAPAKDQVERLLGELQSLRGQLSAAQQRLDSQTAAASGTVANLEKRIAGLQTELQEAKAMGQRAEARTGQQLNGQLRSVFQERDVAIRAAQQANQAREAAQAQLDTAQQQLVALEEALQAAQSAEREQARDLEQAVAEVDSIRAQLNAVALDRDNAQQQASEAVGLLEGSQADTLTLSQVLDAAQAALEERSAAYDAQLAGMQETLVQAEEAISNTNAGLVAAQDTIARLEEDLAAATQRLDNAVLNTGESQQALEETQAALRQAQQEGQRTAQEMRGLQGQIASAEAVRAGDQAELAGLRTQVEELQAAVGQAVEEIEAQNEAQAQQHAAAQDLADQVALKDAELAALQSTIEDLQLRAAEGRAPQQGSAVEALERQIAELKDELQRAEAAAARLPGQRRSVPPASAICSSCEHFRSQVQEANLKADAAVADAVTRIADVEAELRAANRELEQLVQAKDSLLRQNMELRTKIERNARSSLPYQEPGTPVSRVPEDGKVSEEVRSLRTALEALERRLLQQGAELESSRWLQTELQAAKETAASSREKVQQLEAELSQLREFGSGDRGPEVFQRKVQQLRVQLADAETRAASHFVILQQHQQRKDSQERKAAALQARLEQLQADSEASLEALQLETQGKLAEAKQQANDRLSVQQKQMANDRQAYEEAAEHANALISELQESNQQLSEELEAADAKTRHMVEELEGCREQLKAAGARHSALSFQQSALSDQAAFDAGRCRRLEAEVATLTKHLQDTNEDLRQAQDAIERFEDESRAGSMAYGPSLMPPLPLTTFGKAAGTPTARLPISAQETGTQGGWEQEPATEQHWNSRVSPKLELLQKPQPRKPSLRLGPNARTSLWPSIPQGQAEQEDPDESMEPASAATPAADETAEQHRSLSSKVPQASRPNRASITAQIERAGRLPRQLSGKLEAADVAHQPNGRQNGAKAAHSSELISFSRGKRQEAVGA